jgi:hypothetical protein
MENRENPLRMWGLGGGIVAAVFAIWMLFFPDTVKPYFAWPVDPRFAQLFIGAGYIFRTAYFLSIWRESAWYKVRWMYWGNLVFTGILLLATFWHADKFKWPFPLSTGHLWLFLYIAEPMAMIYLAPRGQLTAPQTGGPITPGLKRFLMIEASLLLAFGSLLVLNPDFASIRWPWQLNQLDARIIAAWFLGWAVWAVTMAFASDWDEIRMAAQVNIIFGVALIVIMLASLQLFDFSRVTSHFFGWAVAVLTLVMSYFYWRQERARPAAAEATRPQAAASAR